MANTCDPRIKDKHLPRFKSLDRWIEFFEGNDMGEYLDEMPKARFDVAIKKRTHLVVIEAKLASELTRIARSQRKSSQSFINACLREKVQEPQHISDFEGLMSPRPWEPRKEPERKLRKVA